MRSLKKLAYKSVRIEPIIDLCPDCISHDVTIGTQIWTGCNLNTSTYRDGTIIPQVTDPIAWSALTTGAWCWYNNDPLNGTTYGKLYNWYAVNDSLHGGLAPIGYHLPSDTEWTTLITFLGGDAIAGSSMKEVGFCHWSAPNTGATNSSGFTGLPGGYRYYNGVFYSIYGGGIWWTSTAYNTDTAWYRFLNSSSTNANIASGLKYYGLSVRLIKD